MDSRNLYALAKILAIIANIAVVVGIALAISTATGINPEPLLVIGAVGLIVTLVVGGGSAFFPGFMIGVIGIAIMGTGLGAFSLGASLRNGFAPGIMAGLIGMGILVVTLFKPRSGNLQMLFAVFAIGGAYLTLLSLAHGLGDMPVGFQVIFSPPVLGLMMLASITVAPVIVGHWTLLQFGSFGLGGLAGLAAGDDL